MPWNTPLHFFGENESDGALGPIGYPKQTNLIKRYCERMEIDYPIPGWQFCVAFSFFRLAVILQGVSARLKRSQTSSASALKYAQLFQPCAIQLGVFQCRR